MSTPPLIPEERKKVTIWGDPARMIESQWGAIPYEDWCYLEAARMRRNGGDKIVIRKDGLVCVSRP